MFSKHKCPADLTYRDETVISYNLQLIGLDQRAIENILVHLYPGRFSNDTDSFNELCYHMPEILSFVLSEQYIDDVNGQEFIHYLLCGSVVSWRNRWTNDERDMLLNAFQIILYERIKRLNYIDRQIFCFHLSKITFNVISSSCFRKLNQ